jgi:chaperone modulatory protein CbpM
MSSNKSEVIEVSSVVVDDLHEMTLDDICIACQVERAVIVELVDEGVVKPSASRGGSWCFSAANLPRIARALRLQRDLELNVAGVAFVLDLLNEIESLRKQLERQTTLEDGYDQ